MYGLDCVCWLASMGNLHTRSNLHAHEAQLPPYMLFSTLVNPHARLTYGLVTHASHLSVRLTYAFKA